jgi:hypothetical protein
MERDVTLHLEPSRDGRAQPDDPTIPQALLLRVDELIQ